jgi:hypothetical protein
LKEAYKDMFMSFQAPHRCVRGFIILERWFMHRMDGAGGFPFRLTGAIINSFSVSFTSNAGVKLALRESFGANWRTRAVRRSLL